MKYLLVLVIGCVIGQRSIIQAYDPEQLLKEGFELARIAYRYGCTDNKGNDCIKKSEEYSKTLTRKIF